MSLQARRHASPVRNIGSNEGRGSVDHLPTWMDGPPSEAVKHSALVTKEVKHPHRAEQTRPFRGHSLAD